jgi:hypothetical protein
MVKDKTELESFCGTFTLIFTSVFWETQAPANYSNQPSEITEPNMNMATR